MHELGVVFHIIDDLKEVAEENKIEKIEKVTIELGEVSTVIPHFLTDCWKWASEKQDFIKDTELLIETIPAITECQDCKKQYGTVAHGRICPFCGSEHTYLVQGNEFLIKEIEVQE
ncbi:MULTISPECIES: hydrogenase maturation nickel metallochaperone HypA [unclassified Butyrivibrio]|uniref:hydrogenase maturation nickel metallochaperone HypA n=1 Tax=unclassified Butyrivibrio TaxID=2639466 RepID=UPI0003B73AFD|nr:MULTISPECIES: hydrogenase maturation nickel metallochaperone HypA [unclassified Butyrivibrio]SDB16076.1 hydrogenase nickel incorporation protein HypA/HybF [Butyrivibrio sp. INlla16]SEK34298.1 hydrogenase nickel incorporation protein HypA/HybF [Butyrivibrio sp. ob235]